jgi:two-component system, OmpR family, phosphate regulon sensor histidine kinase PhoR
MTTDSQAAIESAISPAPAAKSFGSRLFVILLASFVAMAAVCAISFSLMMHSWEGILQAEIERSLTQKVQMFADEVNTNRTQNIVVLTSQEGQRAGARATVIDMNGKVIADSEVRLAELENEGRQPEFVTALHGDTGVEVRSRSTFGIPVLYVAVPVSGGAVRLAYPLSDITIAAARARNLLFLGCLVAGVAGLTISAFASARVSRTIR